MKLFSIETAITIAFKEVPTLKVIKNGDIVDTKYSPPDIHKPFFGFVLGV